MTVTGITPRCPYCTSPQVFVDMQWLDYKSNEHVIHYTCRSCKAGFKAIKSIEKLSPNRFETQ